MSLLTFLLLEALFYQISGRTVTVTLNQNHDTKPGIASSSITLCSGDSINIICNASWAPAIEMYKGKTWGIGILGDGYTEDYKPFSFDNNSTLSYTTSFSDYAMGRTKRFVCKTTVGAVPGNTTNIDSYFDRWTEMVEVEVCKCAQQPQQVIKKMDFQHVTLACGPAPKRQMHTFEFQWYLDGHVLNNANHIMEFRSVAQADTGVYQCFAKKETQDLVPVYTFDLKVLFNPKTSVDVTLVNVTHDAVCVNVEHTGPISFTNKVGVYHPLPENYIFAVQYAAVENASQGRNRSFGTFLLATGAWMSKDVSGTEVCLHNLSSATFYAFVVRYHPQNEDIRGIKLDWESLSSQYLCTKPTSVNRSQYAYDPLQEVILANEGDEIFQFCQGNLTSLGLGELPWSPWTKITDKQGDRVRHSVDLKSGALHIRNFSRSEHEATYICRMEVSSPYRNSIYRAIHISDASRGRDVAHPVHVRYTYAESDDGLNFTLKWSVYGENTAGLEKFIVKYGIPMNYFDFEWTTHGEVPVTDSGSYGVRLSNLPYPHNPGQFVFSIVAVDNQGRKSPPARAMYTRDDFIGNQW